MHVADKETEAQRDFFLNLLKATWLVSGRSGIRSLESLASYPAPYSAFIQVVETENSGREAGVSEGWHHSSMSHRGFSHRLLEPTPQKLHPRGASIWPCGTILAGHLWPFISPTVLIPSTKFSGRTMHGCSPLYLKNPKRNALN